MVAGRLAPRTCLEAGRYVPEHQAQLCPFFFSCLFDQWVLDFIIQNRSLGALTLPPMVRADSPVGKGFL